MPNTTKTQIPDEVSNFYDRNLLDRAVAQFLHTMFAQVRDIPANSGTMTIKFRRYSNLAAATTPLSEGVTPAGKQLSVTDITAVVQQYGDFITGTDVVSFSSIDPVLSETSDILGDQAGDTLDQLTRDILNAGTTVARINARATRGDIVAGDVLTGASLDTALRTLKLNKAKKMTSMVDSNTGTNTSPINAAYIAIIHTNLSETVKALSGFVAVEKYAQSRTILNGEIGYRNDVIFLESTNAKIFTAAGGAGIDVYSVLIMGMHAYGTSRISGQAMQNIVKPIGAGDDPLNQRWTSGWKATFVAKILNDDYLYRIECALV